jgi:sugar lactone lactonase YvrE
MKKLLLSLCGIVILLVLYLLFWPVPIDPAAWTPPVAPALEGEYAVNDVLAGVERLESGMGSPIEGVAIDSGGYIYGGLKDGRILRFSPEGEDPEIFSEIESWPLGLDFDADDNLIVCGGHLGLLSIDREGTVSVLTTEADGVPFKNVDGMDIAPDGIIYFSDVSYKYSDADYMNDLMELRPNGRLLAYDPETMETTVVLSDLYFPNGIAVSRDNDFLLMAEMGAYRVLKVALSGPSRGDMSVVIDNMPGFPDGLGSGENGVFWVTIVSPRDELADTVLFPNPFLRKIVQRLPEALMPGAVDYAFLLGIDEEGNILYNLQDPAGSYGQITNVLEYEGMLYLGSLSEDAIGRIPVPSSGE